MRVLAVEPFYGGSHRQFLDQWASRSRHSFELVTFEPRHWKWRMRHSAVSAAQEIDRLHRAGRRWDVALVSDMVNLAELCGLSRAVSELPTVLYFHENQLTYPVQGSAEALGDTEPDATDGNEANDTNDTNDVDLHYAFTNWVSALAADQVWFNSEFHRGDWLAALPGFLRRFPDHRGEERLTELAKRCSVQWPGVEDPVPPGTRTAEQVACEVGAEVGSSGWSNSDIEIPPLRVTWAARWEHDKGPEDLFAALRSVVATALPTTLRLNVLGQSFRKAPPCFEQARTDLAPWLDQWGFLPRAEYLQTLAISDVFVSTARHEFFGMSVIEAMLAGARPLLPRRLSYPELVDGSPEFLYDGTPEGLAASLSALIEAHAVRSSSRSRSHSNDSDRSLPSGSARELARRFSWTQRLSALDDALEATR